MSVLVDGLRAQVDLAANTVERGLERARREKIRPVLAEGLRVRALTGLRPERWDAAARDLNEGLALAREMPYPYTEARLLQVHAELRAQTDFSSRQVSGNEPSADQFRHDPLTYYRDRTTSV